MTADELAYWKRVGGADPKVIGIHGPLPVDRAPMEPESIEFKAKGKKRGACGGCMFANQSALVCNRVGEQAKLRGLDACDAGVIYVAAKPKDPRQLDITKEE